MSPSVPLPDPASHSTMDRRRCAMSGRWVSSSSSPSSSVSASVDFVVSSGANQVMTEAAKQLAIWRCGWDNRNACTVSCSSAYSLTASVTCS